MNNTIVELNGTWHKVANIYSISKVKSESGIAGGPAPEGEEPVKYASYKITVTLITPHTGSADRNLYFNWRSDTVSKEDLENDHQFANEELAKEAAEAKHEELMGKWTTTQQDSTLKIKYLDYNKGLTV